MFQTTYDHQKILHRAQRFPPQERRAYASSFASWVYKLSHNPTRERVTRYNNDRLQSEKFTSQYAEQIAQYLATNRGEKNLMQGWRIEYTDPGYDLPEHFIASKLVVDGNTLRCRPDVVMKHYTTGEILIVERKITSKFDSQIPSRSWPNIRAQLWCYSWIDNWIDAPRITMMDDIWRRNSITGIPSSPHVRRFWDRNDNIFQTECEELFRAYGGILKPVSSNSRDNPKVLSNHNI